MRRAGLAILLSLGLVVGGVAFANGPSNSTENTGPNGTANNNVDCVDQPIAVAGFNVYVGTNGAEVCNDSGPVQGRGIVTTDQGGYASLDGDKDNSSDSAKGYGRIDSHGLRCGDDSTQKDSTNPQPQDDATDCQP